MGVGRFLPLLIGAAAMMLDILHGITDAAVGFQGVNGDIAAVVVGDHERAAAGFDDQVTGRGAVGRLPVVATLHSLGEPELIRIMTEPRNAIVKQYQTLLGDEGVELTFTAEALDAVAAQASRRDLGARGLRMIIENLMLDLMYDLPSRKQVREVVITREFVTGQADPVTVLSQKAG